MSDNTTITITWGDRAENHAGMQMIGDMATLGFTTEDLELAKQKFDNTNSKFDKEIGEYDMKTSDHITLEEESQIFYGDDYDGTKIVLETGTFASASEASEITDVRLISGGNGYTQLPKLDKTNKYT